MANSGQPEDAKLRVLAPGGEVPDNGTVPIRRPDSLAAEGTYFMYVLRGPSRRSSRGGPFC